jgi:alpha-ketoglutarate-dependent taurine dioxygenase
MLTHLTQRQFVYVHEWDMVIFDNRDVVHAVTWYDAENYRRTLWRTTVSGNPGSEYDLERPSWLPDADE